MKLQTWRDRARDLVLARIYATPFTLEAKERRIKAVAIETGVCSGAIKDMTNRNRSPKPQTVAKVLTVLSDTPTFERFIRDRQRGR